MKKTYNIGIYESTYDDLVYAVSVEADNIEDAREQAFKLFENDFYADELTDEEMKRYEDDDEF